MEYLIVFAYLSIPLFLYFWRKPIKWNIKMPDLSFILKEDDDYAEHVPTDYAEWKIDYRYSAVKGMIRKNGKYFTGWFVFDWEAYRYVQPDYSKDKHTLNDAIKQAEILSRYDGIYNETLEDFLGLSEIKKSP